MSPLTIVLVVLLVLALVGGLPLWPHAASWGYWPSGTAAILLIILLLILLT